MMKTESGKGKAKCGRNLRIEKAEGKKSLVEKGRNVCSREAKWAGDWAFGVGMEGAKLGARGRQESAVWRQPT